MKKMTNHELIYPKHIISYKYRKLLGKSQRIGIADIDVRTCNPSGDSLTLDY